MSENFEAWLESLVMGNTNPEYSCVLTNESHQTLYAMGYKNAYNDKNSREQLIFKNVRVQRN